MIHEDFQLKLYLQYNFASSRNFLLKAKQYLFDCYLSTGSRIFLCPMGISILPVECLTRQNLPHGKYRYVSLVTLLQTTHAETPAVP